MIQFQLAKQCQLFNFRFLCQYYQFRLLLKIRASTAIMSQCNFCALPDDSVDDICCPNGQMSCADCIMNRRVNQETVCSGCNFPLKRKVVGLRAKVELSNQRNERRNKNMGMRNNRQQDQIDLGMINTIKKSQGQRNNQNQCYDNNNYNYNEGPYNPNLGYYPNPNFPIHQMPYPPYMYNMNVPMNMPPNGQMYGHMGMIPNPHYGNPNYMSANKNNRTINPNNIANLSPEQFEVLSQLRMLKNASKTILPNHNNFNEEQEERGQGRFWHGEQNNVVYNSRATSKTTDTIQDLSVKRQNGKMTRSNSLNSFTLQR